MIQPWPGDTPPRRGHPPAVRVLVLVVVVLLAVGYAVAAYLTRDRWTGAAPPEQRTNVVFTALKPDGSAPGSGDLDRTRDVLADRVSGLGHGDVTVDGTRVTVSAAGVDADALRAIGRPGRLSLRPVIHTIPAQTATPPAAPKGAVDPKRIADERSLRQSTDQSIQVLALQFQASRCGDDDALIGNDDPNLPLVTCSQDGTQAYLLDRSFIDGDQVKKASAHFDDQMGQYAVEMEFTDSAATRWSDFTAAHIGTQVAFTLDTLVVSAPEIREAIPDGRTQISGHFNRSQSDELAGVLGHGALPLDLTFASTSTGPGPAPAPSVLLRVVLAASGLLLISMIIGTVFYLVVAGRRSPA